MVPIQRSVSITLKDGSSFTHTAAFTGYVEEARGILVAEAVCCNDPVHGSSRHSFPDDITGYTDDQIQAEIADHVQRLAAHHASAHKAKDLLDGLTSGAPSAASGSKPGAGA